MTPEHHPYIRTIPLLIDSPSRDASAHPCLGIRFADGLSARGYEGVGLGERGSRTAKQPQGPARRTPTYKSTDPATPRRLSAR